MHKSARCTPKKMLEILNEYFLKPIGVEEDATHNVQSYSSPQSVYFIYIC